MPVQSSSSFPPSAAFEPVAPRRLRPEAERRAPAQEFTLPAAAQRGADTSARRAGDEARDLSRATRTDAREAAQIKRDAAAEDRAAEAGQASSDARTARSDLPAGDKPAGDARSTSPAKADAAETQADAAVLPQDGQARDGSAQVAGKVQQLTTSDASSSLAGSILAGQPEVGAPENLAALQQIAATVTAQAEANEPVTGASDAGSSAPDEQAGGLENLAGAAGAEQPLAAPTALLETQAAQAAAAGSSVSGQPGTADSAQPAALAPVYALLVPPEAAPAPAGGARSAAAQAAGEAGVAALAGDAAKGRPGLKPQEREFSGSVAHAARQQLADAPEGTEAAPFGALVSALAQTSEIPAEGAQAASAVATITAEGKPAEAAAAPLQPIDLNFLSQLRQPKAEALPTSFAAENAGGPGQAGARAAAEGPATPVHVVPIEIGLRALAGGRKFDIRLDPAELGRVDVNLEISDAGEVTAKLVVDRVETLQLLQRDARTLERAFEQAGLKPSDGGVDITLRDPADQSGFRQNRDQDEQPRRGRSRNDTIDEIAAPVEAASARRLVRLGGVDLSI